MTIVRTGKNEGEYWDAIAKQEAAESNQLLSEFKERIKRTVKKATCDLKSNNEIFAYIETMDPKQLRDLVLVLNGELHQLKDAVLNQQ